MNTALILSHSNLRRDPRILRQIKWLTGEGYSVSTIGCGTSPDSVTRHFRVKTHPLLLRLVGYLIPIGRFRFWYFYGAQLRVIEQQLADKYDLVIVNEVEYLGWSALARKGGFGNRIVLDLHEDHLASRARTFLEKLAFNRFWSWQLTQLTEFVKETQDKIQISSVEDQIAHRYEQRFATKVHLIYNAPAYKPARSKKIDVGNVRLVHHGMGTRARGIEEAISALQMLPQHFTLDLMVFAGRRYQKACENLARRLGVGDRVTFVAPVPLEQLIDALREYTIGVVVIPPVTQGNADTLPNKFFESLHAGLPVIVGPNQTMSGIVRSYDCGWVSENWSAKAIAAVIENLDTDVLLSKSRNTSYAAQSLNEEQSRKTFLDVIRPIRASD